MVHGHMKIVFITFKMHPSDLAKFPCSLACCVLCRRCMVSASVIKCFPTRSLTCCLVCAGEKEVAQSPEAVVSVRDPLSQPVYCE